MISRSRNLQADPRLIREVVAAALAEDIGPGDITSELCIPADSRARGQLVAKQEGVLAGLEVAKECFQQVSAAVSFEARKQAGQTFDAGEVLAEVTGPARALLAAERTALNFLQRLCGIATLTHKFVEAIQDSKAVIVDTRKTTPGLRALEKAAVRAGGGQNHRFALHDAILIKDNHIRIAGGVKPAVEATRQGAPAQLKIEVETTTLQQVQEALAAGADIIMLDNMDRETMRQAVEIIGEQALTEASGGVTLDNVAQVAATGVDLISVGRLTHSAPAIDISLELQESHSHSQNATA